METPCVSSPTTFEVAASKGRIDPADGQLNFTLSSERGALSSIALSARGVYSLQGSGGASTQVGFALSLASVTVLEIDHRRLASPVALPPDSRSSSDHLGAGDDTATAWTIDLEYDIAGALTKAGIKFLSGATKLEVVLDKMLVSIGESGSTARISVDSFGVDVNRLSDPVPTLAIKRSGSREVTVSWLPDVPGILLQQSTDATPGSWTNAPSGSLNPAVLPIGNKRMFFRLYKP